MGLTAKQHQFVDEYLVDLNATQAYLRAGYKATEEAARRSAARLLTNADVQKAVAEKMAKRSARTGITQDYVVGVIQETIERCRQAERVYDMKGQPVFEEGPNGELAAIYEFDAKNVLKGAELLGKHLGIFVDRRELTGKDGKPLVPEEPKGVLVVPAVLSDGDWEAMMRQKGKGKGEV